MRDAYVWIIVAFLVGTIVGTVATVYQSNPLTNPDVMQVNGINRQYTMQWNGENTTLTLVYRDGNMTTLPIVTGQQFTCNASTRLFEGDRLVYQFP
jgi:hypothetical protein